MREKFDITSNNSEWQWNTGQCTWLSFQQQQQHGNFQGMMNYYLPSVLQNGNSS